MPQHPSVKSGTPSKNAENQDAATLTESQPSTSEEVQARVGEAKTGGHVALPDLLDDETQRELA